MKSSVPGRRVKFPRIWRKPKAACGVKMNHHKLLLVVWALPMLTSSWSHTIYPLASDSWPTHVISLDYLATDKNGRPMTFLRTFYSYCQGWDQFFLWYAHTALLSVLEIRPYIKGVSLKFSGNVRRYFHCLDIEMVFITLALGIHENCLCTWDPLITKHLAVWKKRQM